MTGDELSRVQIQPYLEEIVHRPLEAFDLIKIKGDASNRSYYRAILPGSEPATVIIMQMSAQQTISEEIMSKRFISKELPFINIWRYLQKSGLPVPEIYLDKTAERLLFLEDLGDLTLDRYLHQNPSAESIKQAYQKTIDNLVILQQYCQTQPDESCYGFQRRYDPSLYRWELNHFLEYVIEARFAKKLAPEISAPIAHFFEIIVTELAQSQPVFIHRDYQSKNIMLHRNKHYLIDFQDALLGPRTYDLVALLRDSYIDIPADLLENLLRYYFDKAEKLFGWDGFAHFRHEFALVTLQRKLKDAGRFVYIDRVKGNPDFLKYLPTTLSHVRWGFGQLPEMTPLYQLLAEFLN